MAWRADVEEGHQIQGVGGMGLTGFASRIISALPWSAVISTSPPIACMAATTLAEAGIDGFDRLDGRLQDAGVAHHVGVGVVADDGVVLAAVDRLDQLVGHLEGAHFRLEVVGGNVGRRHQDAVFARDRRVSSPPLKKKVTWAYFSVSAMRNWRQAQVGDVFAEAVAMRSGGKATGTSNSSL